jgi:hypothetical protein
MISPRAYLFLVVTVLVVVSVAAAAIIGKTWTERSLDGPGIVVNWMSDDESQVTSYVIKRAEGSGAAFEVGRIDHLLGNNQHYAYTDVNVLKTSGHLYFYTIVPMANQVNLGSVTVSATTSTARVTWGSIKAMFR